MLVTFTSSETGELMMFAEMAGVLLHAVGKETLRRGTFTREEMEPAARLLRAAVEQAGEPPPAAHDDGGEGSEAHVALGPRAWPLIDMLERTARGGLHANIVWEAAADF
jgi:ABC-type amino acid transport substrate-binding protein